MLRNITHFLMLAAFFLSPSWSANAQDADFDALYDLSLEELMNTQIISASKKAESQFDAPLSSTVITYDEMIASGATTIEEALRLAPGLIVREETNGNFDIHIRGNDNVPPGGFTFISENNITLVMIDGRIVFNYINGGTFWETLPVSIVDVERIEIVRGPSTALYGPNAVSGVINIITKKAPNKKISVNGNAQIGNASSKIFDLSTGTSLMEDKLKVRLSGNYELRDRFQSTYYNYIQGEYTPAEDVIDYATGMPFDNLEQRIPDANLAKERHAINGFVDYNTENIGIRFSAGMQDSYAQTVFMETQLVPITGRSSKTNYFNLDANFHGLNVKFAGINGTQNINEGATTIPKYDLNNINTSVEYDLELGNLTLLPGIAYQSATYNDLPYIDEGQIGYLNDEYTLSTVGYYLRGDYNFKDKLRLIAALRLDDYNTPDESYFTYQFISTYNISENHLLRAVYSKANRGPFATDVFTNFSEGNGVTSPYIQYLGRKDIKLPTTHMFELGYRGKLSERVMLDVEAFATESENFTNLEPTYLGIDQFGLHLVYEFRNLDIKTRQLGATFSLNMPLSKKVQIKAYGTVQHTQLENWDKVIVPLTIDPANGILALPQTERLNTTHKQTPSYYGGVTGNFKPLEKLNIWTGLFFMGEQVYRHDFASRIEEHGETEISANTMVKFKASYAVASGVNLFVHANNLFDTRNREFGFADENRGLYTAGLNLRF